MTVMADAVDTFWTLTVMYSGADGDTRFRTVEDVHAPTQGDDSRQLLYLNAQMTVVQDHEIPPDRFTVVTFTSAPNVLEPHREHHWVITVFYTTDLGQQSATIDGTCTPMPGDTRQKMYHHAHGIADRSLADRGTDPAGELCVLGFDVSPNDLT